MLLKSVAVEYAADGIRANSICPGPVESEMVDSRVAAESERLGVPAETRARPSGKPFRWAAWPAWTTL